MSRVRDGGGVVREWRCPLCLEQDTGALIAAGDLALVATHEAQALRRRDELAGARINPWAADEARERRSAESSSSPRPAVLAKPEKKKGKRKK